MLSEPALNSLNKNGVPPHELHIKIGDICFIMRNLNVNDGICNNTRVQVVNIFENAIIVKLLSGSKEIVSIPRIRFQFRLDYGQSFEMIREQFPLRRAYAMTFNKSQGQTLDKVVLDLRGDLFAHGFLYVGVSRVFDYSNIYLYANISQMMYTSLPHLELFNGGVITSNIVYKDVLNIFK